MISKQLRLVTNLLQFSRVEVSSLEIPFEPLLSIRAKLDEFEILLDCIGENGTQQIDLTIAEVQQIIDQQSHKESFSEQERPLSDPLIHDQIYDDPEQSEVALISEAEGQSVMLLEPSEQEGLKSSDSFFQFEKNSELLGAGKKYLRGPYRSYSTEEKQRVVNMFAQGATFREISEAFGIPQKNVVRWCRNGILRKSGAGRRIADQQMQRAVVEWIQENYRKGAMIRGKEIRMAAKSFSSCKNFKSSKGWLKNFVRRNEELNQFRIF